jgi:predicted dehydrogenase
MGKVRVGIVGTGFTVGVARGHVSAYQACPDAEITAAFPRSAI